MKRKLFYFLSFLGLAFSTHAQAETLHPGSNVLLTTPEEWQIVHRDFAELAHPAVVHMLDCTTEGKDKLVAVGWKMNGSEVAGAFCVRYQASGLKRLVEIIKTTEGNENQKAAAAVTDAFVAEIEQGYRKRGMTILSMSVDLINADKDLVMVLDGKVQDNAAEFMRSGTIFMHGDSLLNIGVAYDPSAPASISQELDAIPLSVRWK